MPTRRRASSYQLLRLLETTGQIGVWSLNLRTGEMNGSAGLAHITGLPQDECVPGLLDRLLHPEDREACGELFDILHSGRSLDRTIRIVRPDRTVRWISVKAQIILDAEHRPARAEGVAFDVTGPHEARLLAEQSTARYQGIVDAIAAVVWTSAPDGQARPSATWQALTGQSALEMQGEGWLAAVHPEDRARTAAAWQRAVEQTAPYKIEYRVLRVDGTAVWFTTHAAPLRNPGGSIREWVGIMLRMTGSAPTAITPSVPEITGPLLRGARAMLNWSVTELAAAAGVSVSSVRRLEEGIETVQPRTRAALRRALAVAGIEFVANFDGTVGVFLSKQS